MIVGESDDYMTLQFHFCKTVGVMVFGGWVLISYMSRFFSFFLIKFYFKIKMEKFSSVQQDANQLGMVAKKTGFLFGSYLRECAVHLVWHLKDKPSLLHSNKHFAPESAQKLKPPQTKHFPV